MKLNLEAVVKDVVNELHLYEDAMNEGEYRSADCIIGGAKRLVDELQRETWMSYHTSGTGAI